jgi:hypothetical protein
VKGFDFQFFLPLSTLTEDMILEGIKRMFRQGLMLEQEGGGKRQERKAGSIAFGGDFY